MSQAGAGMETTLGYVPPSVTQFSVFLDNKVGQLHDLLRTWLPRLAEGATAYLVVAKQLGADSLARWIAGELGMPCDRLATERGFRVLRVCAPGDPASDGPVPDDSAEWRALARAD